DGRGQGGGSQHPDRLGCRLPVGARGKLTLRIRLLAAAAGIVAISLLLAGALTWVFVRDLEFQTVQDQLDRQIPQAAIAVKHEECLNRPVLVTNVGLPGCRTDDSADFVDRLNSVVQPSLG